MSRDSKIRSSNFYNEYFGHKVRHLEILLPKLRDASDGLIWTAGDSSLDNKYWFSDEVPALSGPYAEILVPPRMKPDVTYWLNYLTAAQELEELNSRSNANRHKKSSASERQKLAAINTAVEATTINDRTFKLRPQDIFLRDNIRRDDILIVSIGGNDVAMQPCPCTIISVLGLLCLPGAVTCVENGFTCGTVPVDDCCCGCGASLCSCACACPPCLGYLRHLLGTRVEKYIQALTAKTKPAKILVCTIYYPDEMNIPGWAGPALGALGYNTNPVKLQTAIKKIFEEATSKIRIEGSQVIPVPLFNVLNGKKSEDYIQRVEPSPSGGRKMAEFILDIIRASSGMEGRNFHSANVPPTASLMADR